jgi:hypothetical protein
MAGPGRDAWIAEPDRSALCEAKGYAVIIRNCSKRDIAAILQHELSLNSYCRLIPEHFFACNSSTNYWSLLKY